MKKIFLAILFLLSACAPTAPIATPQLIRVYATSASSLQLTKLYDCATPSMAILLSDPQTANITLRLGPPDNLSSPAFQIGSDNVDVVVQSQNDATPLTSDQVHAIFLGQVTNWKDVGGSDALIRVWTYAQDEDIQQIFEQNVMENQQVTSFAQLAVSAQNMLDAISKDASAIGILTSSLETADVKSIYKIASVPLLAITKSQPQGAVNELIACLQK
jgi:hypothetical protein